MRQLKIQKSITNRSSESLDKYLGEISRAPMISIEEEIDLAQQIKRGGREGERAKSKLVTATLRFVVSVAKQYQHQGLTLTDLNQVGSLSKVNQEINKFEQKYQRVPTIQELSQRTDIDEEKIAQSMMASGKHVSIDAPFQEGEDNSMVDIMASGEDSRTDKEVDHESMSYDLNQVLETVLNEREITIIRDCFGIGCPEKGLEEIGDLLGLTRERVRQIREKSITKLRESGKIGVLMKYLG